jgi:hypothetical protein
MAENADPFTGVWELDPETLDYEQGRPGRRAVYTIEPEADGLRFTLDADDADGKPMHFVYGGRLTGEEVAIPNTAFGLALTRIDGRTIESTLKKDGVVIDRWTRTLQPGGDAMLITQHGFKADGRAFRNNGIYRRIRGGARSL